MSPAIRLLIGLLFFGGLLTFHSTPALSQETNPEAESAAGVEVLVYSDLDVFPSSIGFGTVEVGFSQSNYVSIRNRGQEEIRFLRVDLWDRSFEKVDLCPLNLRPGDSCQVRVDFRPDRDGYYSGQLRVSSSDSLTKYVSLSGFGRERR